MKVDKIRHARAATVLLILTGILAAALSAQDSSLDQALAQAKTLYSQKGPRAALPEYEVVLDGYRSAGNRHGEAITIGLIGNCYKRLGDYPKALNLLNSALELKRELHDRLEEGKTLSHLGLVYWETGEYPKAIAALDESIAIARELKDVQLEAASLNNLSLVYDEQGDYRKSLEQYQQALELHRTVNYEPGVSDTLGNIGGVYISLGRYSVAEKYYREALAISQRLQLKPSETQDLGNLAQCLLQEGKIPEALETYDKAVAIARDAGMSKEEADWERGKATALLRLGSFDAALANYESARQTYAKGGLKRELTEALTDAGYAYAALGNAIGAEKKFLQAIAVSRAIHYQRGIIINQLALASLLKDEGDYARAAKRAETARADALKIDDSAQIVESLLLTAAILSDEHRPKAALEKAAQARDLAHRDGLRLSEAAALNLCGENQVKLRQPDQALSNLDAALTMARDSGDIEVRWKAQYNRGQAFELEQREADAIEAYADSIKAIEDVRVQIHEQKLRTGYLQSKQHVYMALIRLLLKAKRTADAFSYSERLREFSYLDLRNGPFSLAATPELTELEARIQHLQSKLESETGRPVAQQRSEALKTYSEELLGAQREYAVIASSIPSGPLSTETRTADPTEIAKALPTGTALLEYVVDKRQLAAFVLTSEGLHSVTTPISEEEIVAKVQLLRELIAERENDNWAKPAASLYAILVGPLLRQGLLKGIRSLIIVPQGSLNRLAFAALPSTSTGRRRFLVQDYEIAMLPSAMLMITPRHASEDSPARLLAFAPSRSKLPYASEEARRVAKMFAPDADLFLGQQATETRFKESAGQYQIIHLATHGLFNKTNPIFSSLQLDPDAKNDGRLEVREILQLNLKARLVTLSACETALGSGDFTEMPAGDEFVSLDRAFLEAGSDAVLASLWKVNDRSTLAMMDHIYRSVLKGGVGRSLAEAQRSMIGNPAYKHPFYWSAFIFIGQDFIADRNIAEIR